MQSATRSLHPLPLCCNYLNFHYSSDQTRTSHDKEEEERIKDANSILAPINIQGHKIRFRLNDSCNRAVEYKGALLSSLPEVLHKIRQIVAFPFNQDILKTIAIATNWLRYGNDYTVIENGDEIRKRYYKRLRKCHRNQENFTVQSSQTGVDLNSIHPPSLEDKDLIFYVTDKNMLPSKVTLPRIDKDVDCTKARYELLSKQ